MTGDEINFRQFPSRGLYPPCLPDGNTLVFRQQQQVDGLHDENQIRQVVDL